MTTNEYRVLLYHGVHPDTLDLGPRNSSGKHIPRSTFERQMEFLTSNHNVVSMREIAAAHRGEGTLPERAVAVTFDDGLMNNHTEAWPVLEAQRIPATIYLATGFIGTGRTIWTDALEDAIFSREEKVLEFEAESRSFRFTLEDLDARLEALSVIKRICKRVSNEHRMEIVGAISASSPRINGEHPLYAFMDWHLVSEMNGSDLIDFGAHTVDHVSLHKVPKEVMRDQIDRSFEAVSAALGRCEFFSYPEGQRDDYDSDVIAHLRSIGFDHAPTAIDGVNVLGRTDPFEIRRCMVGFEGRAFPLA